jgi:hypothetical protein
MALEPRIVLEQVLESPAGTVNPDLMRITTHDVQQRFFGGFAVLIDRGKKQACVLAPGAPASLSVPAVDTA